MTKDEAVELFRVAILQKHRQNIPENAKGEVLRNAEITGDYISRLSADSFEYNFDILEAIFDEYLTQKHGWYRVGEPTTKE